MLHAPQSWMHPRSRCILEKLHAPTELIVSTKLDAPTKLNAYPGARCMITQVELGYLHSHVLSSMHSKEFIQHSPNIHPAFTQPSKEFIQHSPSQTSTYIANLACKQYSRYRTNSYNFQQVCAGSEAYCLPPILRIAEPRPSSPRLHSDIVSVCKYTGRSFRREDACS